MKTSVACLCVSLCALPALAQGPNPACGPAPALLRSTQPNIFSEQQEQWLGDAEADVIESELRPVKDEKQNAYLEAVGRRLLAALPPTSLQFHFLLIDSAEVNGFSLAGGRVYITRKLVANAQSEDELAAVIAHELGHILTHQFAYAITADMKRFLGVTSVGDRADVYAKFQRLMDAYSRDKRRRAGGESDEKQDEADRISIYATAASGYGPQAFADFWDRSFFVGGKTGSGFTDFLGLTKPDEKRLRLMRKMAADLPAGCVPTPPLPAEKIAFQKWREGVEANQAATVSAETRSLSAGGATDMKPVSEVRLTPPHRLDFERVRFSRDGKYILAQDQSSIYVVQREPLRPLFRFDAENALAAEFTPDSLEVVFHTPSLHVERWSIAGQKLSAAKEMNISQPCANTLLAPDGRTIVCLSLNSATAMLNLALLDVDSAQTLFEKKEWYEPYFSYDFGVAYFYVPSSLSEDGNTLVIGTRSNKLAFDLRTRTAIKLDGKFKFDVPFTYAFQGNDKLLGVNSGDQGQSGYYSFPDGKQLQKFHLNWSSMAPVTHGSYVLVPPKKDYDNGAGDPLTGKYVALSKVPALDMWDDTVATEGSDGTLMLYKAPLTDLKAAVQISLPLGPLGSLKAAALSPDGRYLALSSRHRSGIWDMSTGKETYMSMGFTSSSYMPTGKLVLEFPKTNMAEHHLTEVDNDAKTFAHPGFKLEDDEHLESGRLIEWKIDKKQYSLIAHSPADNAVQWTRAFGPDRPGYTINQTDDDLIFSCTTQTAAAKEKLRTDATLKDQASHVKFKDGGRLVEIADPATGLARTQVVIEVPVSYGGADGYTRVGDLLYLSVGDNRTIVYSMTTGAQLRQVFGALIAADRASERVAAINRRDELVIYDRAGAELQHLKLSGTVRFAALRNQGTQLIVLTPDQKVQRFDIPAASQPISAK